ncbi:hypothetical protein ABN034_32345 [Actinopolymorpha sp. B11F2]|uniref:DUF7144 family membrane protein n=1 Tax=Actinopolymorpha sp. B11F2 TaxID=3160862 RepID=UPI0032E477BA
MGTDRERREAGAPAQEKRAEVPDQARRDEAVAAPAARRPAVAEEVRPVGAGWIMFAGAVLVVVGVFDAIWGLAGLFKSTVFVVESSDLVVAFNFTAWGWVHIALGALLVLTGIAVLAGQPWARYIGICLAVLGLIANFLTLAAFPFWSLVMIAIDILVIYALTVHGREVAQLRT